MINPHERRERNQKIQASAYVKGSAPQDRPYIFDKGVYIFSRIIRKFLFYFGLLSAHKNTAGL